MGSPAVELPPGFELVPAASPAALPPGFELQPAASAPAKAAPSIMDQIAHGANVAGTALYKGLADLAGIPSDMANLTEGLAQKYPETASYVATAIPGAYWGARAANQLTKHLPGSQDIKDFLFNKVGIPEENPTSRLGKIAAAGLEAVPSAILAGPESLLRNAIPAALSGAAGEAAGQATQGTRLETPARIGAALLAGGGASVPSLLRTTPQALAGKALEGTTPQEWAAATRLQALGNDIGVPLTGAEALGNAGLLTLQRQAERAGGPAGAIMGRFMRARPGQVQAAANAAMDTVGQAPADVQAASGAIQQAGTDTIRAAELARTAAVSPAYQAARNAPLSAAGGQQILAALDAEIANGGARPVVAQLNRLREDLAAELARPGGPRIGALDSIRKYWRDQLELPPFAAEATPKEATNRIGPILGQLRDTMTRENPDFAFGRALYEQMTNDVVNPLTNSSTGNIARAQKLATQIATIADPSTARPATITQVIGNLRMQNPQAARDLVRLHLENSFDQASKRIVSGPNQYGGAKYSVAIAGSPQQAANLEAALRALPNGARVWRGFNNMLDVFEATGRRIPVGSMTDENVAARALMEGGGIGAPVAAKAGAWTTAKEWYRNFRYGKNTAEMARLLTDPNSVQLLRRLAVEQPTSARAQAIVMQLINANREAQKQP